MNEIENKTDEYNPFGKLIFSEVCEVLAELDMIKMGLLSRLYPYDTKFDIWSSKDKARAMDKLVIELFDVYFYIVVIDRERFKDGLDAKIRHEFGLHDDVVDVGYQSLASFIKSLPITVRSYLRIAHDLYLSVEAERKVKLHDMYRLKIELNYPNSHVLKLEKDNAFNFINHCINLIYKDVL